MNFPHHAGLLPALALLTLSAALAPARAVAQSAPANQTPSPNGKIVYQSTAGSDSYVNDIYVMDADGKRQTRLTDDAGDDVSARWSPQGGSIAFLSNRRGGGFEIFLMNADGSNQRPLRDASPVVPSSYEWSPEGTHIAYSDGSDVYVVEVTSGGGDSTAPPVNVSVNKAAGTIDRQPSWSPDGSRLAVQNSANCPGCSDLNVITVADGTRVALGTGPGFDSDPSWSADGSLIAYEGDRGGRGIYVTPASGAGTESKVSGAVGSFGGPVWSPAGARLAFRSLTGRNVYAVNADATGLTLLSEVPSTTGDIFWSPDGSKVGFH
ncbi:MAG TPA: hypothetical protein VF621_07190, partial [Pyrinomonadaceae bacterium]